eukprot:9293421-Alexandrium_andersonii.AAC.1
MAAPQTCRADGLQKAGPEPAPRLGGDDPTERPGSPHTRSPSLREPGEKFLPSAGRSSTEGG